MFREEDDQYDTVIWENQGTNAYDAPSGPGFKQSTSDSEDKGPHEPKWEGYLITEVKDPVKELPETKDSYVSYLVTAKVSGPFEQIVAIFSFTISD